MPAKVGAPCGFNQIAPIRGISSRQMAVYADPFASCDPDPGDRENSEPKSYA
jgi:hypothetical protein